MVNVDGAQDAVSDGSGSGWTSVSGPGSNVTTFFLDSSNGRLYAGTQSANVVYSDDGGQSWENLGLAGLDAEFTWVHARGQKIIVGYNQFGGRMYYSTDGGTTFTELSQAAGPAGFVASNGDLYAISPRPSIVTSASLLRSTDDGATWTPLFTPPNAGGITSAQGIPLRQRTMLYVDGDDIIFGMNRVYVSHDGGQTFEEKNEGLPTPRGYNSAVRTMQIHEGNLYILIVDDDDEAPTSAGFGLFYRPLSELGFAVDTAVESFGVRETSEFAVWPNPAVADVYFVGAPDALGFEVVDLLGRSFLAVPAVDGRAHVDASGLAPGVYLVRERGRARGGKVFTVVR